MNPVYVKKRYVITFDKDLMIFTMVSPNGQSSTGTIPWMLSNQAFDAGADEVFHDYDLSIVDSIGKLRYSK